MPRDPGERAHPVQTNQSPFPTIAPRSHEEALVILFRGFREYYDETTIAAYMLAVGHYELSDLWSAVKRALTWASDDGKAPSAPQLRQMVLQSLDHRAPVQRFEEEWKGQRATPQEMQEMAEKLTPGGRAFLREALGSDAPAWLKAVPVDEDEASAAARALVKGRRR